MERTLETSLRLKESLAEDEAKNDPTKCPHYSINRVLDQWFCTNCGAEFIPTNPEHQTSFRTSMKFKT